MGGACTGRVINHGHAYNTGNGGAAEGVSYADWSKKWQAVNGTQPGRFIDSVAMIREEEDEVKRLADMTRFTPVAVRRFHQLFVELSAIQYGIHDTHAFTNPSIAAVAAVAATGGHTSSPVTRANSIATPANSNGPSHHQRTASRSTRRGTAPPAIVISTPGGGSSSPMVASARVGGASSDGHSNHTTPRTLGLSAPPARRASLDTNGGARRPSIFQQLMGAVTRPKLEPLPTRPLTPGRITRSLRPEQFCLALALPSSSLLAQVIFNMFDIAQTTRLSFRGFIMTLAALSVHGSFDDKVRLSFGMYDTNRDGIISMHELMAMLRTVVTDGALSAIVFTEDQLMDMARHAMRSAKLLARRNQYALALRENLAAAALHSAITARRHGDGTPATPVSGNMPDGVEKLKLTGDHNMPPMFFPTSVHTPPAATIPLPDEKEQEPNNAAVNGGSNNNGCEEKTMDVPPKPFTIVAPRPKVLVTSDSEASNPPLANGSSVEDDIIISDSTTICMDEYRLLMASSPAFLNAFTMDVAGFLAADDRNNGTVPYLPADQPKKKLKKVANAGKRHTAGVASLPPLAVASLAAANGTILSSPHSSSVRDGSTPTTLVTATRGSAAAAAAAGGHHRPARFSSSVDEDGNPVPAPLATTARPTNASADDSNSNKDHGTAAGGGIRHKRRSVSVSLSTRTYNSFAGARAIVNVEQLQIDDDWAHSVPGAIPLVKTK